MKFKHQQQHIYKFVRDFHLVDIYEDIRMVHAEYTIKTLEAKILISKELNSEAEKIKQRFEIKTYMFDCLCVIEN